MERFDCHLEHDAVNWAADKIALDALGFFAVVFVLAVLTSPLWLAAAKSARRFLKECGKSWPLAVLAVGAVLYAGTKPPATANFVFDEGLENDGSWQTNNTVHIAYSFDFALADFAVHVDAREKAAAQGTPWMRILDGVVKEQPFDFTLQNASNFTFLVWSEYVAPPVVHTNGVYQMSGVFRAMGETNKWITPRIPIRDEADGENLNGDGR